GPGRDREDCGGALMMANASRPGDAVARLGLLLAAAAGLSSPAPAEPPGDHPTPEQALRRAEQLYRQDRLPAAEQAYRQALRAATDAERRLCFDRLLAIYARVGRPDQAIGIALEYERWMRRAGEAGQAREL